MTVPHPHIGPAVAAAALVVAVIVASAHPVAAAMEADDGTLDEAETEADRAGDVDGEPAEAPEDEATTTDVRADADSAQPATQQSAPDPEPIADPEPVEEPNSQPAAAPDAESVPDPDAEADGESAPQPNTELAPEPAPAPAPDPDPEPTPESDIDFDSDRVDESVSETEAELEEASDSTAELAPEEPDPESDSQPEAESSNQSPSAPSDSSTSTSPTSSSTSGSAGSAEPPVTNDSDTRSASMTPQPSPDEPPADTDDAADNQAGLAVAPAEGAWPKRTVETAGETVRPLATQRLSGADLAALKSTNASYRTPTAGESGVRAPMVAGPGDRQADESVPAPRVAAATEGGTFDRVADALGGAVSGGELAGIPAVATVPMWLMLTGLALLLVVVAGHLRWVSLNPTTASPVRRPRSPAGGAGR